MNINNITIGTDVEFFVVDEDMNSVSVEGKLGGTKAEPLSIGNDCYRQEDNVNAEFCMGPVKFGEKDKFISQIQYCREKGNEILAEFNLHLLAGSSREIPEHYLQTEQTRTFGCDPSYCVYTQGISEIPGPDEVGNLRTCGFHLHVGFENVEQAWFFDTMEHLIRLFDLYLAVPSVIVDLDTRRREIYGNPGDFRFRFLENFSIFEYRCLGGSLLASPETIGWAFDQLNLAIKNYFEDGANLVEVIKEEEEIQRIIRSGDQEAAEKMLQKFGIEIPNFSVFEENFVNTTNKILVNG